MVSLPRRFSRALEEPPLTSAAPALLIKLDNMGLAVPPSMELIAASPILWEWYQFSLSFKSVNKNVKSVTLGHRHPEQQ